MQGWLYRGGNRIKRSTCSRCYQSKA
uniref:Uncharacterized protein n=1 Tax=Rhizophora mucronata TaxID=61149 RepID=A0A2P2PCY1_RHIMU